MTGVPAHPLIRRARFSKCRAYRYTLERIWSGGDRVCWVMLNPSTADHEKDDPTITRVMHFSRSWGFGAAVVVNLYPLITSKPSECKRFAQWYDYRDWHARDVIQYANEPIVTEQCHESQMIVAAWGRHAWEWDAFYVDHVMEEIWTDWPTDWNVDAVMCLGTNKDGSPKHPLARGRNRVPDDQQPIIWRYA